MRKLLAATGLLVTLLGLSGCVTTTPQTSVHQPMSVRPASRPENLAGNGSIFQAAASRPLFEDRRARYVGDTLIVSIVENTSASTKSNGKAERAGSVTAGVTALSGVPNLGLKGLNVGGNQTNTFDGKGESAASNLFSGTMTVTVIEVLANGNLLVSGEKQVSIGPGNEYVRLSGVVNPYTITAANTVNSSQIADARVEYKSSGYIADAQNMGWLARFFLNVLPF